MSGRWCMGGEVSVVDFTQQTPNLNKFSRNFKKLLLTYYAEFLLPF